MENLGQDFYTKLKLTESEEEETEAVDAEFSFNCGELNNTAHINPIFPLFDRNLLISGQEFHESLPIKTPVKKMFVEANGNDEIVGPYCLWSNQKAAEASPEVRRKSNSTGSLKSWRVKDFMGKSRSDGKDSMDLFKNSHVSPPVMVADWKVEVKVEDMKRTSKDRGKEKKKKSGQSETASLSPVEVYLKRKAKHDEQRRHRSYLPYR